MESEYPSTTETILAIDTETYNALDAGEKNAYKAYTGKTGYYVDKNVDLSTAVVTPLGSYFTEMVKEYTLI